MGRRPLAVAVYSSVLFEACQGNLEWFSMKFGIPFAKQEAEKELRTILYRISKRLEEGQDRPFKTELEEAA
jgi:2-oxo-4-hydroxy-4-carboxy--5-ureidoimidazoline (OHCU) decarboxylase